MRSIRAERLKALLQAEIANFMTELRQDLEMQELIGVDEVVLTPDLKMADVWVSFTPTPDEKITGILMQKITSRMGDLKSFLAERLELRQIPRIELKLSDPQKEYNLDRIFEELDDKD